MADRPILFKAPMVRALLDGRKTETRRIIEPQPIGAPWFGCVGGKGFGFFDGDSNTLQVRYAFGDRLWVKEAFRAQEEFDHLSPKGIMAEFEAEFGHPSFQTFYEADRKCNDFSIELWQESPLGRLRASMHMPRCASRITLHVTEVRVERLQDICEADAVEEGIECYGGIDPDCCGYLNYANNSSDGYWLPPVASYASLWNHINGPDAWDANPWVAAYTFFVIAKNIDEAVAAPSEGEADSVRASIET